VADAAVADSLAGRLRDHARSLSSLRSALVDGAPWPLSERFDHSDEAAWGPPEILAHIGEMLPYWHGEAERVIDGKARGLEPVPFGRTATDDVRIGIIGRDRSLPVRELLSRIDADAERLASRMETLRADELLARGRHPTRGELTVAELLDRFAVTHFEEHIVQLRTGLSA
jgi:hypothetical protein